MANQVVLLPKPAPAYGTRPIGLSCSILRGWARLRLPLMSWWERVYQKKSHWAIGAKSCERAAWCHQLVAEAHLGVGRSMGSIFIDLKRFYECVCHGVLLREGLLAGVPLTLLATVCRVYRGPRCLMWEGLCTETERFQGTMVAGCALAPALSRALLSPLLATLEQIGPEHPIWSVIDDLAVAFVGTNEQVLEWLVTSGEMALDWFQARRLPISTGKCVVMGSTKALKSGLLIGLGEKGFKLTEVTKHLGVEASTSRRRRGHVRRARIKLMHGRFARLRCLRRAGAKVSAVCRAGGIASVAWGSACWGLTGQQLHGLRSALVRTAFKWPRRCKVTLPFVMIAELWNKDAAGIHHGRVMASWVENLRKELVSELECQQALRCSARQLVGKSSPWASVFGPAGTLLLVACRLDWQVRDAHTVITDKGEELNLMHLGMVDVAAETLRATRRKLMRQAGWGGAGECWVAPFHRAVQKAGANGGRCLEIAAAGGSWCAERMWAEGMCASPVCLACGDETQVGSEEHRLFQCVAWRPERVNCLSRGTREWLESTEGRSLMGALVRGPLPLDGLFLGPQLHEEVHHFGAPGLLCGHLFVDGSARAPRDMALRRCGWSVVQLSASGEVVRGLYGVGVVKYCPQQTAGEAEDMAVGMLARYVQAEERDNVRVYTDCANTAKALRRGPNGGWAGRSRAVIWREVWAAFPNGLEVVKVKAHRTRAECGGDQWELFLHKGNEEADRWAKVASARHPGGLAQIERGHRLSERIQEVYRLRARQGELLAKRQMMDHLALEEVQPLDRPRVGRPRGRRARWAAPEWLKALAEQAEPRRQQGGRRGVPGAQGLSMPLARLALRHESHSWRMHRIMNDADEAVWCHVLSADAISKHVRTWHC
eukprot:170265-Amphidinium_carterae.1